MSFPAAVRGPGTSIGFPDVCNTPAGTAVVPTPYTNTGTHSLAQGASETVKIIGMSALTTASTLSATQGDEAGTAMGTTSGTVSSTGTFTGGSANVYIDGIPAVRLTSSTTGNNMNNSVGTVTVPGAATVLFSRAEDGRPIERALTVDEVVALVDAVERGDTPLAWEARDGVLAARIDTLTTDIARRFFAAYAAGPWSAVALDLRACSGGDLEAAIDLASAFVDEGTALLEIVDEDGDVEVRVARPGAYVREPVTLLVGAGTKSAAEAFALAMERAQRASVVGGPTFGKRSAQAIVARDGVPRLETRRSFG